LGYLFCVKPLRSADQVIRLAIEMAAPFDPLPVRPQPVLPAGNPDFRRQTVLDEKQLSAEFERGAMNIAAVVDPSVKG
jgi:hypothetical protein